MFTVGNYQIDPDLYYDPKNHFWLRVEGDRARIGMDPLVQESLGAPVVVQFEGMGKAVTRGESFGTMEAEKYVGPLRSPVSGVITKINEEVVRNPRFAVTDPYGQGWLIELQLTGFAQEKGGLLTGRESLKKWFEEEIRKYREEGWLAEP